MAVEAEHGCQVLAPVFRLMGLSDSRFHYTAPNSHLDIEKLVA